ncbi:heme-binding protein 2-like [Quercus lobata]|uniref:SOUL heme-binding family protein n=1 Tax=Quercus lobata TaxID=97700 RepID=A0A7N2MNC5_QUELO|nr:heme-binding protein 2-like [Quercus lobata]
MENPRMLSLVLCFGFLGLCQAIESPQYSVVHSESDFEIRLYRQSTWMSAPSKDISFEKATKFGFHRLFQYIQGANLNFSRIAMTAPVLTSIVPEAGPLHSSAYFVRFYLPVKFQASPPLPLPELNLKPYAWDSQCIAVRKFSGFARDSNIVKEAEKLAISLSRSPWANATSSESSNAYSIAQYNSPFQFIGRVNEVWVEVDASEFDGCKFSGVATY